jgi:hypothetical protein
MANEPKTIAEMAADIAKRVAAQREARKDPQVRDDMKAVKQDDRDIRRELDEANLKGDTAFGIRKSLEKQRQISKLSATDQDLLGKDTSKSAAVEKKLTAERDSHKETKTELRKAQSTVKALEATVKKLEARVAQLTKAADKATKAKAPKAPKAQAQDPASAPNG